MSKVTLKSDALAENRQYPYERRCNPKNYVFRLRNWAWLQKMSKVTLKSDALAENSQYPYERCRNPINYVFRLKNWAWSQMCPK